MFNYIFNMIKKIVLLTGLYFLSFSASSAQSISWTGFEDAEKRIEKIRKGDLEISVVDAQGRAVRNANVHVKMLSSDFGFGGAISARYSFTTEGIKPGEAQQKYLEVFRDNFRVAVIENGMKWTQMQSKDGKTNDEVINRTAQCVNWLQENDIPIRGHTVIWPSWENMPAYLKDHEDIPREIREIVRERFENVLTAYKDVLFEWDLVNEPAHHRDLLNIFGEEELARYFFMAKEYDKANRLYINQWYALNGTYHPEYLRLIRNLVIAGAPLEGIGLQGHLNVDHLTNQTEIESIWHKLNQYAVFGLPIKITELDINGDKGDELQAKALENALKLFYSHPAVEGMMLWGFWQGRHWRSEEDAGLWELDWTAKPAAKIWKKLVFDTWWTDEKLKTDHNGIAFIRGYTGEYEITVEHKGKVAVKNISLTRFGEDITVEVR